MRATLICIVCILIIFNSCKNDTFSIGDIQVEDKNIDTTAFRKKAKEALTFIKQQRMSQNRCILIDICIHSGLPRWIEWDYKKDKIVSTTQVTHGCEQGAWGKDKTNNKPRFSNLPDSHLSSLGRYKIGERGASEWGIGVKYILHGLDSTNSNAAKRFIVLHSWDKVSEVPTYPKGAPESWVCPAVSNKYMLYIDSILKNEKKPVLMWIYCN